MLPRFQSLFLALIVALLIVFGTFGIFTAEASSFRLIISNVQTYGAVQPLDANDPGANNSDMATVPSLPY